MNAPRLHAPVLRAHERLLPARGKAAGLREKITARLLCALVRRSAQARGLDADGTRLRLFGARVDCDDRIELELDELLGDGAPERIGDVYEAASALEVIVKARGELALTPAPGRKQRGVFFTPPELTRKVVASALERLWSRAPAVRVCDPAVGGGAFLIETLRQLAAYGAKKARIAEECLYGVDRSPLAIAVAEAALWLEVADPNWDPQALAAHLRVGDSLAGFDWKRELPELAEGFELVIGNPPWVAYAGRAAQPLSPDTRAFYARSYRAFRGYPTLHGMFVERAAELAPRGVVALLLPSPVADLEGYAPVRGALSETHTAREPLLEFGQDAFEGVTQPCFALIADPTPDPRGAREWRLAERQRHAAAAEQLDPPEVLARIAALPSLPRELFGEMGFQSAGEVSKTLFLRSARAKNGHDYPLLEGKDVGEFRQGPARLYLKPDRDVLARARCRLRPASDYARVAFVVRQTAVMPIAALHSGLPFRNTLLAGFELEQLPPALMVALLNSSLYRALHVARRRDARQAVFPQVKIAHLRALPRPPENARLWSELVALTRSATDAGMSAELRSQLDRSVFELFDLAEAERAALLAFLAQRGIGGGS